MRFVLMTFLALFFVSKPAHADDGAQYIPPVPHGCPYQPPYGEICLHTFGGARMFIPLADTKGFSCDELMFQLFHMSPTTETEVGKPVNLKGDKCRFVPVDLPAVSQRTIFRVLFSVANSRAARFRENPVVSEQLVAVYPPDLFAPLRDWSKDNSLVVIDRLHRLSPLLDSEKIKYATAMPSAQGGSSSVCVWVPVSTDGDAALPFGCTAALVLREHSPGLIEVAKSVEGGHTRIDVGLPLLEALPDSPLAQKSFVDMVLSAARGG